MGEGWGPPGMAPSGIPAPLWAKCYHPCFTDGKTGPERFNHLAEVTQ